MYCNTVMMFLVMVMVCLTILINNVTSIKIPIDNEGVFAKMSQSLKAADQLLDSLRFRDHKFGNKELQFTKVSDFAEQVKHLTDAGKKSYKDQVKNQRGHDTKEEQSKSRDEHGGKDRTEEDEDNQSFEHHSQKQGSYGNEFKKEDSNRKRKLEKGFSNKYHKKEYHKVNTFFGDHHADGDYKKFGKGYKSRNKLSVKKEAAKKKKGKNTVHKKNVRKSYQRKKN